MARRDVAPAVQEALAGAGTLYAWAARHSGRVAFAGRGPAFAVPLGPRRAVVRHARHGGLLARLTGDRFYGTPRAWRELDLSRRLALAGVPTPTVLAAAVYRAAMGHRADVATDLVDGLDLFALFFGAEPPPAAARQRALESVGSLVRRLHEGDLVHPDLQLRNLLLVPFQLFSPVGARPVPTNGVGTALAEPDGEEPRAYLLDVDTCRAMRPADRGMRERNLRRFFRSWDKWNRRHGERLTAADREVFLAAYRGAPL